MARTRAANPAAEDARPAAVGKLFAEQRRRGYVESGAKVESDFSREARRARREERQA